MLWGFMKNKVTKKRRVLRAVFVWSIFIAGFLFLRYVFLRYGAGIPCPINYVTGLYCPGCGTFRAIEALLNANFLQAVRYNALTVALLPIMFFYAIRETFRYIHAKRSMPTSRMETIIWVSVVAASIIYGIARNLPHFAMLQPTSL